MKFSKLVYYFPHVSLSVTEPENSLPQCDLSFVVKEKVCDNVDMKTEESDESHILTALSTPSGDCILCHQFIQRRHHNNQKMSLFFFWTLNDLALGDYCHNVRM